MCYDMLYYIFSGLQAIREGVPDLPPFLDEYEELIRTVYGLCAVHATRNAGSKKMSGYAAVRNFCRAATKRVFLIRPFHLVFPFCVALFLPKLIKNK